MKSQFWEKGGLWAVSQWILMGGTLITAVLWPQNWNGLESRWAAIGLLLPGAIFGIWGTFMLGRHRTIFPEPPSESTLVTHGIFGLVRHPLYTSVILLSFAWALWWRSYPSFLLAIATTVFLEFKARNEEKRLRDKFSNYADYANRVKRLIPFLY